MTVSWVRKLNSRVGLRRQRSTIDGDWVHAGSDSDGCAKKKGVLGEESGWHCRHVRIEDSKQV